MSRGLYCSVCGDYVGLGLCRCRVVVPRADLETVREALRFARDQDYRHSGGGTILISSDGLEPVAAALDLLDRLLGDK